MATINPTKTRIKTMAQVKSFIKWAQDAVGYGFSPHVSFHDYIGRFSKKPLYNESTATLLDFQISNCFIICEENNVSLYEICWQTINMKLFKEKKWGVSIAGKRKPKQ